MQTTDLTRDQARALKNKLQPMLGYLGRLKRRMMRRGFLNADPLLELSDDLMILRSVSAYAR